MTHEDMVGRWLKVDGVGVEIGAFKTPVPGITPFYVDRFANYAGEPCLADYWGDACSLPFHSSSLDYVVASHVLEHVANPVAALVEWHRVLRSGGIMYMIVPDRRATWDWARAPTDPEHMWTDFVNQTDQCDGTHVDDFIDGVDWSTYSPSTPPEALPAKKEELRTLYRQAVQSGNEINIHFHVFEPRNLRGLIQLASKRLDLAWNIVAEAERFPAGNPNGTLMLVHVLKPWRHQVASWWWRQRARRHPSAVLKANASPPR